MLSIAFQIAAKLSGFRFSREVLTAQVPQNLGNGEVGLNSEGPYVVKLNEGIGGLVVVAVVREAEGLAPRSLEEATAVPTDHGGRKL